MGDLIFFLTRGKVISSFKETQDRLRRALDTLEKKVERVSSGSEELKKELNEIRNRCEFLEERHSEISTQLDQAIGRMHEILRIE